MPKLRCVLFGHRNYFDDLAGIVDGEVLEWYRCRRCGEVTDLRRWDPREEAEDA